MESNLLGDDYDGDDDGGDDDDDDGDGMQSIGWEMPTPMSGPPQGPRMGENCPLQGKHSFQKTALTQFSLFFFSPSIVI